MSTEDLVSPPKSPNFLQSLLKNKTGSDAHSWLIPGESAWEIWSPSRGGEFQQDRVLNVEETDPVSGVAVVGLPATLVTCQLFWLETAEEKAVPDLLRMQCERRLLLRQDEVWTHRIIRREEGRMLAQVLILQNALPGVVKVDGPARFEAMARCLDLPPRTLSIWRSLGFVCFAFTDETGVVYFQPLPHRALSDQCLHDLQCALWLAVAQKWVTTVDSVILVGDWNQTGTAELEATLQLPVQRKPMERLVAPPAPMELVPRSVTQLRITRRRQHRIKLAALALAALYALFLAGQILSHLFISASNAHLQAKLDAIMPSVVDMQNTARQLDALNPALDVKTYPMEILYRATAVLPDKGVRLTRFDIAGSKVELSGESSTAREAFDYINALEKAGSLNHISWDEAPQPVPLPNDTTRFTISGTIAGAYNDSE